MSARFAKAAVWLGPAALLWGLLAFVARIATVEAATATDVLFLLALPLTYVALVGTAVHASARPRQALIRGAALTLGLLMALTLLELAGAARLAHWELFFFWLRNEEQHYVADPDLGSGTRPTCGSPDGREATSSWRGDSPRPDRIASLSPTIVAATATRRNSSARTSC